jgi:hypothetical protein
MENELHLYVKREIECLNQFIQKSTIQEDDMLNSLENKIIQMLPNYAELEEAEKMYDEALKQQKSLKPDSVRAYWIHDDLLRTLDFNKKDIRERMLIPFYEKIANWKAYQLILLEKQVEQELCENSCLEYAFYKNGRTTKDFMHRIQFYIERRTDYEKTGNAYPDLFWLLEYEYELFPWGLPKGLPFTKPIIFYK